MSEEGIGSLLEAYKTAVSTKNVHLMLSLYDASVTVFDMWGSWVYEGREAWGGAVEEWFGSLGKDRVEVDFERIKIKSCGDLAVFSAFVNYRGFSEAGVELRSMKNRISWAVQRVEGEWKVLHEHSSAPADFDTLKVIMNM